MTEKVYALVSGFPFDYWPFFLHNRKKQRHALFCGGTLPLWAPAGELLKSIFDYMERGGKGMGTGGCNSGVTICQGPFLSFFHMGTLFSPLAKFFYTFLAGHKV